MIREGNKMFCSKCGSPINEGEKFCSVCGEKVEAAPMQQNQAQPDGAQQPYGQQPYGNMYSVPKKSKKGLAITLSLVAVLAIAAVLIFVVFGNQAALSQGLFKGDTPQTQFANNAVRVFSDAFAGFGDGGSDIEELAKQPFDITMDISADAMGQPVNVTLDAAYDNETLGMNLNAMGSSVKMLLLEDVLYMDMFGSVAGLDFNSSADLSKPMPLEDRLMALVEDLNPQENTLSKEDYMAIAEMFLNSIDEKCFKNSDSRSTLTLGADDVVAALRTFAEKLDADKELKEKLEDYIEQSSGTSVDVIKEINDAADSLEGQEDAAGVEIVWDINFENGKPVSFEITAGDGIEEYALTFGYKKDGDSTDIEFELVSGSSSADTVTGSFSYTKTDSGMEFEGDITVQGESLTIEGSEEIDGDKANGTITINIPETGEITLEYEATIKIGMPDSKVKDDERFEIDTENATVTSLPVEAPGLPIIN
jgi:hypothetical protein